MKPNTPKLARARACQIPLSRHPDASSPPDGAAKFLSSLNARTVVRWAREGYIPAFPIGEGKRRLWRFLEADLEAWMMARRQGGLVAS